MLVVAHDGVRPEERRVIAMSLGLSLAITFAAWVALMMIG